MMLREELIPTAIVEDCGRAGNFLGLICCRELQSKKFSNMSRFQILVLYLPPLQSF